MSKKEIVNNIDLSLLKYIEIKSDMEYIEEIKGIKTALNKLTYKNNATKINVLYARILTICYLAGTKQINEKIYPIIRRSAISIMSYCNIDDFKSIDYIADIIKYWCLKGII